MAAFEKLTDRMLSLLGLDLDFSISLESEPFNLVGEDLFVGARPEPAQAEELAAAGITHVVSCLHEDHRDKVAFLEERFSTLFVPMRDGMHEDIAGAFPSVVDFVATAGREAKVLVHCEAGVSRSATLAIAILMRRSGGRFYETYCAVRDKRPQVLPNIGFASQLQKLEIELQGARRSARGAGASPSSLARYLREVCMVPVDITTLDELLHRHDFDAVKAIRAIFGDEIPRVVQGAR